MRTDAESLGFLALTPEALHEVLVAIARKLPVYWEPAELIVGSDLKDTAREIIGSKWAPDGYEDPETGEWVKLDRTNVLQSVLSIVVDESRLPEKAAWSVMAVNGKSRLYFVNTQKGVMEARAEYVA